MYAENAGEAVRLCEALLEEPELDPAVRIGDAFGFLVEHHCQQGNFQEVIFFSLFIRLNYIMIKGKHPHPALSSIHFQTRSLIFFTFFFSQAYRKLEELQKLLPSQNIRYYISQASLEALQKEMGLPMDRSDRRHNVKEEDEVEEDLNVP